MLLAPTSVDRGTDVIPSEVVCMYRDIIHCGSLHQVRLPRQHRTPKRPCGNRTYEELTESEKVDC